MQILIFNTVIFSSAIAFNLEESTILSFDEELSLIYFDVCKCL